MLRTIVLTVTIAAASAAAWAGYDAAEHGALLLAPFKTDLKAALLSGLEAGPDEAIDACKEQAPAIASAISVDGVRVGRSSHRLRNPDNAAPDWVSPILASYLESDSDRAPVVVSLPDNRTGYVEPIITQPLCLTCHGEVIGDQLASRIQQAYPHDEATGFEVGDLRGVFWAEFPAADD